MWVFSHVMALVMKLFCSLWCPGSAFQRVAERRDGLLGESHPSKYHLPGGGRVSSRGGSGSPIILSANLMTRLRDFLSLSYHAVIQYVMTLSMQQ